MVVFKKTKQVLFASERSDSSLNLVSAGIASERSVHVELVDDQRENNVVVNEMSELWRSRVNAPTTLST